MELTQNKSYKIQVLRGLAIIAVVFIHNTPNGLPQVWCRPFLNFSVGCFLFLSGMLSNAQRRNPTKRIMKVIIPYVIWTLPYVIVRNIKQPGQIPASYDSIDEFVNTLQLVFENRVSLCTDCNICNLYKKRKIPHSEHS